MEKYRAVFQKELQMPLTSITTTPENGGWVEVPFLVPEKVTRLCTAFGGGSGKLNIWIFLPRSLVQSQRQDI